MPNRDSSQCLAICSPWSSPCKLSLSRSQSLGLSHRCKWTLSQTMRTLMSIRVSSTLITYCKSLD